MARYMALLVEISSNHADLMTLAEMKKRHKVEIKIDDDGETWRILKDGNWCRMGILCDFSQHPKDSIHWLTVFDDKHDSQKRKVAESLLHFAQKRMRIALGLNRS